MRWPDPASLSHLPIAEEVVVPNDPYDSEDPAASCPARFPSTTYVVIPTLNEAQNLVELIRRIDRAMVNAPYRVLVVDDGSTDGTQGLVEELATKGYPIDLLERGSKQGIGSAIRDGLTWCLAKPDSASIVTMDADLSHDPRDIPRLLHGLETADLVQGSRYVEGGRIHNWGLLRRLLSLVANAVVHVVLNTGLKEHTTYFRTYSRRAAEAAVRTKGCDGYDWALGSLVAVRDESLRVQEVPITFRDRKGGDSKLTTQAMIAWLFAILAMATKDRRWAESARRLPLFAVIGGTGILVNQAIFFALYGIIGLWPLVALTLAIESSIVWNFLLNDRWTFRGDGPRQRRNRLVRYHVVCVLGVAVNMFVFTLLALGLGVNFLVSNLIAILAAFLANFRGSASWAWVAR